MRTAVGVAGRVMVVVLASVAVVLAGAGAGAAQPPQEPTQGPTAPPPRQDPCEDWDPPAPWCPGELNPTVPVPVSPPPDQDDDQDGQNDRAEDEDPAWWDVGGQIRKAINGFLRGMAEQALNPLLDLLDATVLATSPVVTGKRVTELWRTSQMMANAFYGLVVMVGGMLLMSHETLQTRYAIKHILPRLVVGFLAGNLSLLFVRIAAPLGNAIASGLLGGGADPDEASATFGNLLSSALAPHGPAYLIWFVLIAIGLLVGVLGTHVFCTAVLVLLVFLAPFALACHGLPQTEAIAHAWWRLTGAMLAVPTLQSACLIAAVRIFLDPDGFSGFFGVATPTGLGNVLIACVVLWILVKIPFWLWGTALGRGHRSALASAIKGVVAYKTLGLLGGGRGGSRTPRRPTPADQPPSQTPDPYRKAVADRHGQYQLPLQGVRRVRIPNRPAPTPPAPPRRRSAWYQPTLGTTRSTPPPAHQTDEHGQYQLPITADRTHDWDLNAPARPTPAPPQTTKPPPGQAPLPLNLRPARHHSRPITHAAGESRARLARRGDALSPRPAPKPSPGPPAPPLGRPADGGRP